MDDAYAVDGACGCKRLHFEFGADHHADDWITIISKESGNFLTPAALPPTAETAASGGSSQ
ncbi:hypothetical protein ACOM2C_07325 [Pseudarthrobacter sp. So.54]